MFGAVNNNPKPGFWTRIKSALPNPLGSVKPQNAAKDLLTIKRRPRTAPPGPTPNSGISNLPAAQQKIVKGFVTAVSKLDTGLTGVHSANDELGKALKSGSPTEIAGAARNLQAKLDIVVQDLRKINVHIEKMRSLPPEIKDQYVPQLHKITDIAKEISSIAEQAKGN